METHRRSALVDELTRKLESAEESIRTIKAAARIHRGTKRVRAFTADFKKALRVKWELERRLRALSEALFCPV